MTVWLPLRISTTCDALFTSCASAPDTKNPQNACALFAHRKPSSTSRFISLSLIDLSSNFLDPERRYFVGCFGTGCPGSPSCGSDERTTFFSATCPRGAFARSVAADGELPPPFGGPPHDPQRGSEHDTAPVQ